MFDQARVFEQRRNYWKQLPNVHHAITSKIWRGKAEKQYLREGLVVNKNRNLGVIIGIFPIFVVQSPATEAQPSNHQRGNASVYSDRYIGKKTASGSRYNPHAHTAASPYLPFGTVVRVTNEHTRKSLNVTIIDRQLSDGGRVLDLSKSAARQLGVNGVAPVSLTIVSKPGN